jgi:anaerobic selenocysteine-containing dehydrogenase
LDKAHDIRDAITALWANRDRLPQAWKILSKGTCDDALGGMHLCPRRLQHLARHTMPAFAPAEIADISQLRMMSHKALHTLGRIPFPFIHRPGDRGFSRISWDEALGTLAAELAGVDPQRLAFLANTRGLTLESGHALRRCGEGLGSPHVELWTQPGQVAMDAQATCALSDLGRTDLLLIVGDGIAAAQPALLTLIAQAKKRGTRVVWVHAGHGTGLDRHWAPSMPLSLLFGSQLVDDTVRLPAGGELAFLQALQPTTTGTRQGHTRDADWVAELLDRAGSCITLLGQLGGTHPQGDEIVAAVATLHAGYGFVNQRHSGTLSLRGKTPGPTLEACMAGEIDMLHSIGPSLLLHASAPEHATAALSKVAVRIHQGETLDPAALIAPKGTLLLLPAQTRHEQRGGGTLRAVDGRIFFSPQVPGLPQVGEARPAWEIPCQVAVRLQPDLAKSLTPASGDALRQEMDAELPQFHGIAKLKRAGDWVH